MPQVRTGPAIFLTAVSFLLFIFFWSFFFFNRFLLFFFVSQVFSHLFSPSRHVVTNPPGSKVTILWNIYTSIMIDSDFKPFFLLFLTKSTEGRWWQTSYPFLKKKAKNLTQGQVLACRMTSWESCFTLPFSTRGSQVIEVTVKRTSFFARKEDQKEERERDGIHIETAWMRFISFFSPHSLSIMMLPFYQTANFPLLSSFSQTHAA